MLVSCHTTPTCFANPTTVPLGLLEKCISRIEAAEAAGADSRIVLGGLSSAHVRASLELMKTQHGLDVADRGATTPPFQVRRAHCHRNMEYDRYPSASPTHAHSPHPHIHARTQTHMHNLTSTNPHAACTSAWPRMLFEAGTPFTAHVSPTVSLCLNSAHFAAMAKEAGHAGNARSHNAVVRMVVPRSRRQEPPRTPFNPSEESRSTRDGAAALVDGGSSTGKSRRLGQHRRSAHSKDKVFWAGETQASHLTRRDCASATERYSTQSTSTTSLA
jgi:hypothetical protein